MTELQIAGTVYLICFFLVCWVFVRNYIRANDHEKLLGKQRKNKTF